MLSLPYGEKTDIKGTILVHIDEAKIRDLLEQIDGANRGMMFLVNEHQEVIMSTGNENIYDQVQPLITAQEGFVEHHIAGEEHIVSMTTSVNNGWKYVSVVPTNIILAKVYQIKTWSLILFVTAFFIGIIISYFFSFQALPSN